MLDFKKPKKIVTGGYGSVALPHQVLRRCDVLRQRGQVFKWMPVESWAEGYDQTNICCISAWAVSRGYFWPNLCLALSGREERFSVRFRLRMAAPDGLGPHDEGAAGLPQARRVCEGRPHAVKADATRRADTRMTNLPARKRK